MNAAAAPEGWMVASRLRTGLVGGLFIAFGLFLIILIPTWRRSIDRGHREGEHQEIECREPNDLPSGDETPCPIWSRVLDLDPATERTPELDDRRRTLRRRL
jgi:hypothetical protein